MSGWTTITEEEEPTTAASLPKDKLEPGMAEVRKALDCMNLGWHRKALDYLMDGAEQYAEFCGVDVPWDS